MFSTDVYFGFEINLLVDICEIHLFRLSNGIMSVFLQIFGLDFVSLVEHKKADMCFVQKLTILGLTHLFRILFLIIFAKSWQFSGKL